MARRQHQPQKRPQSGAVSWLGLGQISQPLQMEKYSSEMHVSPENSITPHFTAQEPSNLNDTLSFVRYASTLP